MNSVLTIGHSTHTLSQFCALLVEHRVTAIADVRSTPYSARNPQFNRDALQETLQDHGLAYVFLGAELGARPASPSCYVDGRVQYTRLASTDLFQAGLARLRTGIQRYRLALLCAEADPLQCHRTILICRQLKTPGLMIQHVLPSGILESQEAAERRLLKLHNLSNAELFSGAEELLSRAYGLQEDRIAYNQRDHDRSTRVAEK